ncbi:PREDICTED: coiled-coil [Prunus dulcis]|uniref:PREDICTED: coiled-coil n=1 Tax=Prunus dulcis TaxID=3755 RepID=A0A5E4F6D8_PRUDU|nr:PREDICTED: coiled-coil [Prunus dulcis]
MAAEEDSIEQVVAARQERLRALKAAQELLNTPDEDSSLVDSNADEDNETSEETMKFRNYVPHDKKLQEGKLVPPVLPKFEDPVAAVTSPSEKKEDPFVNIAPKKPNWELRRDVQKKLDKLERRTQKAMCKLMALSIKRSSLFFDVLAPRCKQTNNAVEKEQEKQKQLDEDGRNGAED